VPRGRGGGVWYLVWRGRLCFGLPMQRSTFQDVLLYEFYGALMIVGLTSAALVAHTLPLGLYDTPNNLLGVIVLMGMAMLYVCLGLLQKYPQLLKTWRRWSYAGFYVDEVYTRLSLKIWPTRWNPLNSQTMADVLNTLTFKRATR
jgi:NAD(P)H-quinone oxidoreductase subunit 5